MTINQKKRSDMESLIYQATERALVFSQNLIVDEATKVVEKGNEDRYYQNLESMLSKARSNPCAWVIPR